MQNSKRQETRPAIVTDKRTPVLSQAVKDFIIWHQQDEDFLQTAHQVDQLIYTITEDMQWQDEISVRKSMMKTIEFLTRVKVFFYRIGIQPEIQKIK